VGASTRFLSIVRIRLCGPRKSSGSSASYKFLSAHIREKNRVVLGLRKNKKISYMSFVVVSHCYFMHIIKYIHTYSSYCTIWQIYIHTHPAHRRSKHITQSCGTKMERREPHQRAHAHKTHTSTTLINVICASYPQSPRSHLFSFRSMQYHLACGDSQRCIRTKFTCMFFTNRQWNMADFSQR
jgi:hypothetical protein